MFCLNLLSNCAGSKSGDNASLTAFAATCISEVLANSTVIQLIGNWTVGWGPEVRIAPKGRLKRVAANTMFVAKQTGEDGATTYVVAIAGTNPDSLYGWFGEDFDVKNTLPWTTALTGNFNDVQVYTDTAIPVISAGTAHGLKELLNKMTSADQSLVAYLTQEIAAATAPVEVIVTGHSLGGALSASVALFLADNQGPNTNSPSLQWDPNYKAIVSAMPSAGAPPGNVVFAKHYDAVLGTRTNRIWNSLDVIPHAWEPDLLVQAPHLYFPYIAPNIAVRTLVDVVLAYVTSSGQTYQQINRTTAPLPGQVDVAAATADISLQQFAIDQLASIIAGKIAKDFGWPDSVHAALTQLILAVLAAIVAIEKTQDQAIAPPTLGADVSADQQAIDSWLQTLGTDVTQNLATLATNVAQRLDLNQSQLTQIFTQLLAGTKDPLNTLASELKKLVDEIVNELIAIVNWLLPLLAQLAGELNVAISEVLQYLPGIAAFLSQLVIQHVPAYSQLLGVTQYAALQKSIRMSIPYTPPPPPLKA